MGLRRISFSVLLPVIELMLWVVLVPSHAGLEYLRFRQIAHGAAILRLQFGEFTLNLPRERFLSFAFESAAMRESAIISSINIPGIFIDGAVSQLLRGEVHRNPLAWTWEQWRAISFPFFALPAWWFAGRGLDALLGFCRPRWWTLLIGTLLCAGFLTMFLGLRFGVPTEDRVGGNWIFVGLGLWTLAFAQFPIVWLRRGLARPVLTSSSSSG